MSTAESHASAFLDRNVALAGPRPAPLRALGAAIILRRAATQAGVSIVLSDGQRWGPRSGPTIVVRREYDFFARVGRLGAVGFGEAFMAGDWTSDDLVTILAAFARTIRTLVPPSVQRLRRFLDAPVPAHEDNDLAGARRNIAAHYDLSTELFATFLDRSLTYSGALFSPGDDLESAQTRKIERLLDRVGVDAGTSLLEIGTGWGELAIRAGLRGARVHTITLSGEQARVARDRIERVGLSEFVTVDVCDYRELSTGPYDAIVSIEMIEAVGERWWPTYFTAMERLLTAHGRIGLQAIIMPHDRMMASRNAHGWINKYVFPGGLVPSGPAIDGIVRTHTNLQIVDRFQFGEHYATTLRQWRARFDAADATLAELGFGETFRRMWSYYLAYCEAGFRAGHLDVTQLVIVPRGDA